jgi:hypothetical protein
MQALIIGMGCKAKNRVIASVLARFLNAAERPRISWLRRKGVVQSLPEEFPLWIVPVVDRGPNCHRQTEQERNSEKSLRPALPRPWRMANAHLVQLFALGCARASLP